MHQAQGNVWYCFAATVPGTKAKPNMIRVVPAAPWLVGPGFRASVAVLALALANVSTTSHAEVAVKGPIDRIQVDARNSSVAEILGALGEAFDLRYRTSVDLNRPVTGTFHGPMLRVISRLLTDYDYVVKSPTADQI